MEKEFFSRSTEKVAKDLLGSVLHKNGMKAKIVETEAYLEDDPASHAYPEKTDRNRLMYETHGHVYIYLCYGIHHMLNFTAEKQGVGGILIRALEPLEGIDKMKENRGVEEKKKLCNGPGKICQAMNIDKELNGIEVGQIIQVKEARSPQIISSKRIGISKAKERELRYYIKDNEYVSKH